MTTRSRDQGSRVAENLRPRQVVLGLWLWLVKSDDWYGVTGARRAG
ncbi:hypothetical protein [uncultured Porticoccus sp.]|nr:hypothetical protein [uncultured Porticoccus sp.]